MLKWFKILLLTVCFAFSCQAFAAIESSSDKLLDSEKHGVVYDHQQKPQTALSESLNFVRLCSSMSERVLPSSNLTQTLRTSVRTHYLFSTQKNSFTNYRGLGHNVSKPILALPSCAYYVLTLRHLLC